MQLIFDGGAGNCHTARRRHLLIVGAGVVVLPRTALPQTPVVLKLTRIAQGPELARLESAYRAAYEKLGMQVEFVDMPGERAIVESNAGRVDGETARIAGMQANYPDLRLVDVPVYIDTISIFVYGKGKVVPSAVEQLSSMKRVGIIGGWKGSEEATAGWKNIVRVTSFMSALQMLKLGRLDAFLGRTEDTYQFMQREGLSAADFPTKIVQRFPMFHYLHKKHEGLLPAITRELLRLKGAKEAVVDSWTPLS